MAALLVLALNGAGKDRLLQPFGGLEPGHVMSLHPAIHRVAAGSWAGLARADVRSGGYCVDSLEAALWCFSRTDSFEACVLEAANPGVDADTTAKGFYVPHPQSNSRT